MILRISTLNFYQSGCKVSPAVDFMFGPPILAQCCCLSRSSSVADIFVELIPEQVAGNNCGTEFWSTQISYSGGEIEIGESTTFQLIAAGLPPVGLLVWLHDI